RTGTAHRRATGAAGRPGAGSPATRAQARSTAAVEPARAGRLSLTPRTSEADVWGELLSPSDSARMDNGGVARRVSSPHLSGRAEELRLLNAALRRADDGEPGVVFVGGEAGIGKTRL